MFEINQYGMTALTLIGEKKKEKLMQQLNIINALEDRRIWVNRQYDMNSQNRRDLRKKHSGLTGQIVGLYAAVIFLPLFFLSEGSYVLSGDPVPLSAVYLLSLGISGVTVFLIGVLVQLYSASCALLHYPPRWLPGDECLLAAHSAALEIIHDAQFWKVIKLSGNYEDYKVRQEVLRIFDI
jgi:hypothetical protein